MKRISRQKTKLILPPLLLVLLLAPLLLPAPAQAQLNFSYMGVDESASLILIIESLINFLWKFNAATIPLYFLGIASRLLYRIFF
jgi:hypothetical protein